MTDYTPDFTTADVVAEVRRLAAESPDYVYYPKGCEEGEEVSYYTGCSYVTGADGKGCIVGQALANLGVPEVYLSMSDGENALGALAGLGLTTRDHVRFVKDRTPEENFLIGVQTRQDDATAWGEAVEQALPLLAQAVTE